MSNYKPVFSSTFDTLPHQTGHMYHFEEVSSCCVSVVVVVFLLFADNRSAAGDVTVISAVHFFFLKASNNIGQHDGEVKKNDICHCGFF